MTTTPDVALFKLFGEDARFYREIGRFIVSFSELEFSIRFVLGAALRLPNAYFDPITSTLDFASLCRVTRAAYNDKHAGDATRQKAIDKLFSDCLRLNDTRIKIVHATWAGTASGRAARHVSRHSYNVTYEFDAPEKITQAANEAQRLNSEAFVVLGGLARRTPTKSRRPAKAKQQGE